MGSDIRNKEGDFSLRLKQQTSELGIGKVTFLVFSLIIGAVIYCAYHILPFYYYYYELMNQMESVIRVAATESDMEIRKKLYYHIRKMELPVGDDEELNRKLRIDREQGLMRISLAYEEVFYVYWNGKDHVIYRFPFNATAVGKIQ